MELLVVVAIISVLAIGVGLSVGRSETAQESDAAAFKQRYDTMRDLAIHGQDVRGLFVDGGAYQVADREHERWMPSGTRLRWRGRVRFEGASRGASAFEPEILFLPNGATTPFSVQFLGGDLDVTCTTDGWAGLICASG